VKSLSLFKDTAKGLQSVSLFKRLTIVLNENEIDKTSQVSEHVMTGSIHFWRADEQCCHFWGLSVNARAFN
jgi:hypothetical protein